MPSLAPATRWRPLVVLAVTAVLVLPARPALPARAEAPIPTDRVAGADRYETAARLARRAAGEQAVSRVWLATGTDFPDAMAASAAGEPILLVTRDVVPRATAEALRTIDPDEVVAVGGPRAIRDTTLATAADHAGAEPTRVAGADRFATSVAVAGRTHPDGSQVVWLATGSNFPDALAAGPVAAAEQAPLLLVSRTTLPSTVRRELARLAPQEVVVTGGPSAIDGEVARRAADAAGGATITRLAGADRHGTATAIADRGRQRHGLGTHVYLATGEDFPDALAAGPAASADDGVLLLATRTRVPGPTRQSLVRDTPDRLTVTGGTAALSRTVRHRAARPWLVGACDLYDVGDSTPIQGHPEGLRPTLDAWSGPWVIDDFRDTWGMAVPHRWRQDRVEAFEHRGVLFYVDTEDGYDHRLSVTVLCGNPFLVGDTALSADDPAQIADLGPHPDNPDEESFDGPALYSATYHGDTEAQRYDYVAVDDDILLVHYLATNRFARELPSTVGDIADAVAASVTHARAVTCPPNASACQRR